MSENVGASTSRNPNGLQACTGNLKKEIIAVYIVTFIFPSQRTMHMEDGRPSSE
jgi:hypothetical protein